MNERTLYCKMANDLFDSVQLRNPDYPDDSLKLLLDTLSDIDLRKSDRNAAELARIAARLAPIADSIGSIPPLASLDGGCLRPYELSIPIFRTLG